MADTKREMQIQYIMENEYANDSAKHFEHNLAFLQSLSDYKLNKRYEHVKWEVDHQD